MDRAALLEFKGEKAIGMEHFYQNLGGEDFFNYQALYTRMVQRFDNAHFVEVGAFKGKSAVFLAVEVINSGKNIKFDCIDNWKGNAEHNQIQEVKDRTLYDTFLKNIDPVKNIINVISLDSMEAVKLYADESLDFVFVDASHEYEDVKNDISHWIKKVKKGGVLAGHDFNSYPGVTRAVDELLLGKYSLEGMSFICEIT